MRLGPTRTTPPPRHDLAHQFPELAELRRTSVRLHPRRGEPELLASKLGGDLAWPSGELWPLCREPRVDHDPSRADHACHVGVLQLRQEDVPELGFPPGKDLFQMTWCPRPHHEPGPRVKVFWRATAELADAVPGHATPTSPKEPGLAPEACTVAPERVVEYPAPAELPPALHDQVLEWAEELEEGLYDFQLSVAPGSKVGGHVTWLHRPEIPRCRAGHTMQHLATIASSECDVGSHARWLAVEDREAWDSPPARLAAVRASGIMVGDMGSLVTFVCRRCPGWPIAWTLESA